MKTILVAVLCCVVSAAVAYAQSGSAPSGNTMLISADGKIAWRMFTPTGQVSVCVLSQSLGPACSPYSQK